MTHPEEMSAGAGSIFKQLIAVVILATVALLIIGAFSHSSKPFSSVEVKFTDASAHGLAIVPASCPSNPFDADAPNGCSGDTPLCPDGSAAPGDNVANCGGAPGGTPTGGSCPAGSSPSGSLCVEACQTDRAIGGLSCSCPTGFSEQNGECVAAQCPLGYSFEGGSCVLVACPSGYTEQNGSCVVAGQCNAAYICSGSELEFQSNSCSLTNVQACAYGCSAGACNAAPSSDLTIQASPILIKAGETSVISWSASNVTSCTVTGTNGDSWSGLSGSNTSSAIQSQVVYTLSCEGDDGQAHSQSVTVSIVPTFNEQ